jgi:signal transduction histidine kinase
MLRILMVEDMPVDAELISDELRSSGIDFDTLRVYERDEIVGALERFSPDVILSDYRLPACNGAEVLAIARKLAPDVPFIFVTGALGEDQAAELMKKGATDFVLKDRLSRLPLCVERALRETEERRQLKQAEAQLETHRQDLEELVKERTSQLEAEIKERRQVEEALRLVNETLEQQVAERTRLAESRSRQLQALAVEAIEAEERERRRIAQILHDDLQQILAAARMQVEDVCRRLPSEPVLAGVELMLVDAIAKARRLSHELSPAVLYHSGLVAALKWLARQMDEQFGLQVDVEADVAHQFDSVPLAIFLFRAVQELLFNVVKHAGVKNARVRLGSSADCLDITVSDQGHGFNPGILDAANVTSGLGLLSIRERARYIGGRIDIESAVDKGSRFTLSVPFSLAKADKVQPSAYDPQVCSVVEPKVYAGAEAIRVLFVDDHQVMRQGLMRLMNGQPEIKVVGEASNGREAIEQVRQLRPDVVVMDVSMPEMDGVEATRHIKLEMPEVRVIGLSMFEDEHLVRTMREAGAEAFLSKTTSSTALLKAIYKITGHR